MGSLRESLRPDQYPWVKALIFNHSLPVPVRWKRAERIPTTSRYARGIGSINSADHVLLLEDLQDGRLRRKRGQFLCGAKISNPVIHQKMNVVDTDAERSKRSKVTCKKCLEMTKRWEKQETHAYV